MTAHKLHVGDPWYGHIASGTKVIEGRLNKGTAAGVVVGDVLNIHSTDIDFVSVQVLSITPYQTFREMLQVEGLSRTLPGINSVEEGVQAYLQYYELGLDLKLGVLAIEMKVCPPCANNMQINA